ncbi:hypothetical protein N0V95_008653 [Ascochyta clinopodiicola]|nr:hypothetical protein N0V95_008653 [Ascochyta clinopodiicola]
MKLTNLTLSILGFASLAAAQNGNDPLILNNRTGLAPVVYDTFSTSYTKLPITETANGLSQVLPVTAPFTQRSNTFLPKPTTSVQCWRDGYPCGQDGGKHSLRRVADFARATPAPTIDDVPGETGDLSFNIPRLGGMGVGPRVPPPEFFSTRSDVPVPGETGDGTMNILPLPTEFISGTHYDAPPESSSEALFSILPIPTERGTFRPSTWPSHWRGPASHTIDCTRHYCPHNTVSTSISYTPLPATYPSIPAGPTTTLHPAVPPEVTAALERREAGVPIDWWRGSGQSIGPEEVDGPSQGIEAIESQSSKCGLHYCPSWKVTVSRSVDLTSKTTMMWSTVVGPGHTSYPDVPPTVPTGV